MITKQNIDMKPSTSFCIFLIFSSFSVITYSVPFVVFHAISDSCTQKCITELIDHLSNFSGIQGHCIETGGAMGSWFKSLDHQTKIACEKVKAMNELNDGYNIVGVSQGNMIARGVIELCDGGPRVKNYISLAGPQAGVASISFCWPALMRHLVNFIVRLPIYTNLFQEHLSPTGFMKIPTEINSYLKKSRFLPKLNNEIHKNSTYKERFCSLENLVLIMFEGDTILVPKETSLFGYYRDGSCSEVLPAQETELYKEDWIGLKTLDEAGKVKFVTVSGAHRDISTSDMKKYMIPYLKDEKEESKVVLY